MAYITRIDIVLNEGREKYDGVCSLQKARRFRMGFNFNCVEIEALKEDDRKEVTIFIPSETILALAEMIRAGEVKNA